MSEIKKLLEVAIAGLNGEKRVGQEEMALAVAAAIKNKKHLLVQAGTGTGKSLAYLLPLIENAIKQEHPFIVATATLSLQTQIFKRDLPRLLEIVAKEIDKKIKVVLIKGRRNYICKHKILGGFPAEETNKETLLFDLPKAEKTTEILFTKKNNVNIMEDVSSSSLGKEILHLRNWAKTTKTGDRDDLDISVSDRAWGQVSVNAFECLGANKCPLAFECFSEQVKEKALKADIVVTNHALLALDSFSDSKTLPPYEVVVIDEAHELVDKVTSAVSEYLSQIMVTIAASSARKYTAISVTALQEAAKKFEEAVQNVSPGLFAEGLPEQLALAVASVRDAARVALSDSKGDSSNSTDGGRNVARARLQEIYDVSQRLLDLNQNEVVWLEADTLHVSPLSVAQKLRENLFAKHTVIATSATLALGGNFELLAKDMGLENQLESTWETLDVGSPFDYKSQAILYIAKHLPKPGQGDNQAQLAELQALLEASRGAALCLFSSRNAANVAAKFIRDRSALNILCQGEENLSFLLQKFSQNKASCLFGTMALWQGVDVPGDFCRLVVIDRIPFPRPDDPLTIARTRFFSANGSNGFMNVSAKQAAIKLSQGVGRLIRTKDDRGVVAILDSRISQARYGSFLLSTLPDFWRTDDRQVVLEALKRLGV